MTARKDWLDSWYIEFAGIRKEKNAGSILRVLVCVIRQLDDSHYNIGSHRRRPSSDFSILSPNGSFGCLSLLEIRFRTQHPS
jgi:hypothetical protein